jgi:hypothetical protein
VSCARVPGTKFTNALAVGLPRQLFRRGFGGRGVLQELDRFTIMGVVCVGVGVKKAGIHKNLPQHITSCKELHPNFRWSSL